MFALGTLRRFAEESGIARSTHWRCSGVGAEFGVGLQYELEQLRRAYRDFASARLAYSSFYERFTLEMVRLHRLCLAHGLSQLRQEPGSTLDERLQRFHDVFLQDSSVVRLHAKLATKWPTTRTRTPAAGVKIATLVSLKANGPHRVELRPETIAEITSL